MDSATKKIVRKEIESSTIPEELKLLNVMAASVRLLSSQCFERLKAVYVKHGYKLRSNESLSGISQYCDMEQKAAFFFAQRIDPMVTSTTFDVGGIAQYDGFNSDCNELIRLLMLYVDRCSMDSTAYGKIFKLLRQMPSKGIFKDEDIARFKLQ